MAVMSQTTKKLNLLNQLKIAKTPLSLPDLATLTANVIPERTLRRWLVSWVNEGIIERSGQKRGTRYQFVDASSLQNNFEYGQQDNNVGYSLLLNAVKEPSPNDKKDEESDKERNNKNKKDTPPLIHSFSLNNNFLKDIPRHRREPLLEQIRDLWTHNSTALEGNTLTLGDTHAVLGMGLTVSGKPLREHQEIVGHAKAIDLLYQCIDKPLTKAIICDLHTAVQTDIVHDIFKPIGNWKVEINGTYTVGKDSQQRYIEYAHPLYVDSLMTLLIDFINSLDIAKITPKNAAEYYAKIHMAFVHIHPFWDGNGRMARLISNTILLKAGLPPLVINKDQRREYIECLADYQITVGQLTAEPANPQPKLWTDEKALEPFIAFCANAYESTKILIEDARR